MIYRFKSKAAADLIMMEPAGDTVLRVIGRAPAAKGIIESSGLAAAITAIEQAVSADEAGHRGARADAPTDGGAADDKVSLRQRAWPLLEMMRRAQREGADIVWGV